MITDFQHMHETCRVGSVVSKAWEFVNNGLVTNLNFTSSEKYKAQVILNNRVVYTYFGKYEETHVAPFDIPVEKHDVLEVEMSTRGSAAVDMYASFMGPISGGL